MTEQLQGATDQQIDTWISQMEPDQLRTIVREHRLLRSLCGRHLLVATGADDWVARSETAMAQLRDNETELRVLLRSIEAATITARQRTQARECGNCRGTGRVSDAECVCCYGTGKRQII